MPSFASSAILSLILFTIAFESSTVNSFIVISNGISSSSGFRTTRKYRKKHHVVRATTDTAEEGTKNTAATSPDQARSSSFEDAQVIGEDLAKILTESCRNGEPMPEEATTLLRALVSTTSGARGWFVSLLTNPEFEPVFVPPIDESFLSALCANPDPNIKLMTMNVAMSTATEITHREMGNDDLAENSAMTSRRAIVLAKELLDRLDGLREEVERLRSAVDGREGGDEEWIKFCKKWGYGDEQKETIRKKIEVLLN